MTLSPISQGRRFSHAVDVGGVIIGGEAPIRVQSMTNTDTEDRGATIAQILSLAQAGSELVRITVNTPEAAKQVPYIVETVRQHSNVPIIGDFHYNGHRLLTDHPDCARALDKYRINPGNVGFGDKRDLQFGMMIEAALVYNKPIRIGVNWGSLDQGLVTERMNRNAQRSEPLSTQSVIQEAMVMSAVNSARFAESLGLPANRILLACKTSGVQNLIQTYLKLASECEYALHLGLTEAGMGTRGIVASTAAISILLQQGIGDTIRASLTPTPDGDRREEVRVCQSILQTMGLRAFTPQVTACPGCGRTSNTFYQSLAQTTEAMIATKMPQWSALYDGVENLSIAVMGCIVNGPGESKHANIGISLPGNGEDPAAPVFIDGKKAATLRGDDISTEFQAMIEQYIQDHYSPKFIADASPSSQSKQPTQIESEPA